MNDTTRIAIVDGDRVLFYKPLRQARDDGVIATLVGYMEGGQAFWY